MRAAARRPPQCDERVYHIDAENVRCIYKLLREVFCRRHDDHEQRHREPELLHPVVRDLMVRFSDVHDDVVEDNVFEATGVIMKFYNDGSSDILTEDKVDSFLVMESRKEELFPEGLRRKNEANDVARHMAGEVGVELVAPAEKTALCRRRSEMERDVSVKADLHNTRPRSRRRSRSSTGGLLTRGRQDARHAEVERGSSGRRSRIPVW